MGDPRKIKSKYNRPGHPWQKERIEEERTLLKKYGLKNKTEIYRARSKLKTFSDLAKKLIAARGSQAEKEKTQLLARLAKMGLVEQGAQLDDVLGIQLTNILERRLQTMVFRKGLARSINQARQMIVHEHILVGNRRVSSPSYNVHVSEEASIAFVPTSSFANTAHPERALPPKATEPPTPQDAERQGPRKGPSRKREVRK
ncbi:MAG: 30S ribosomal protein S4 [Candidatus Woesearchaeota archaeon]